MNETNRIEYKKELTPELDIEKEVVAFLNYKEGGYIYIGIDKTGQAVGVITVYYKDTPLGSVEAVILEDHARNPILHGISLLSDYVTSRAFAASAVCAVLLLGGYFLYVYSGQGLRPRRGKYTRRR